MEDIRWQQRFNNYNRALAKLSNNIHYIKNQFDQLNFENDEVYKDIVLSIEDIFKQGLIQSFEFTHELAWKVMQDFAKDQGQTEIRGSKDATRYAAQVNLITDGHTWMDMILSRNESSHTYNEAIANEIFITIITKYHPLLLSFKEKIEEIRSGQQGNLL